MSRRTTVLLAIAAAVPLAAGVGYATSNRPQAADRPSAGIPTGTARVTRGTLTEIAQLSGVLQYTGEYQVGYQGEPGVLTAAPVAGTVVGRGGILYRVSDVPVRLLLGAVPVYRDFGYGMTDGPDVRQLERNLVALGLDPHHRITVDRHFSAATAAAIRRWEASWGRPAGLRTGRLTRAQMVFLPTPLRVTAAQARIGGTVAPGAQVLTGTSTDRAVVARMDTSQDVSLRVGDRVQVALPDADPIPGRVTAISAVATTAQNDGDQPADPNAATVPVTISLRVPRDFTLAQAPVTVDVTTGSRSNVLLAPIAALLARPGGGYQVRLAGGGPVPVEPGHFDDSTGQVEIVSGLSEGQSVEVPAT
ncbi:hypothetical protein ODJ79_11445 [Actinoplanes sp. KI2]|uniref:peptidoglycan-binding protein n=1 Tax=Actinoplanes sp. KI2 TaxID=2983315 RepID=UPI0021D572AD|nr:peptidoglycan-binding protein [Actinoplanes sp. KI2]MCU7724331.1 hypothetical protein [Actinoplanes sp. KI2]